MGTRPREPAKRAKTNIKITSTNTIVSQSLSKLLIQVVALADVGHNLNILYKITKAANKKTTNPKPILAIAETLEALHQLLV